MSSRARRQIDLILRDAVRDHTAELNERLQGMYASHSAKGRLHSGATVQVAVRIMDGLASEAVQEMSAKVLEIARGQDSFSAFEAAVGDLIEFFRDQMPTIVRMASARMPCEPSPSVETAAYALFDQMESKIERKVEIIKYGFTEVAEPETVVPPPAPKTLKTGRPSAAFWDEMWAAIASALYNGDLVPRTQADIEKAMLEWIEGQGHTAATSTVRARARRLWDLLQRDV